MKKKLLLIGSLFLGATLIAAFIRNQQFHLTPPEVARKLKPGMSPREVERALNLQQGSIEPVSTNDDQYEYQLVTHGLAGTFFAQDDVTLIFDHKGLTSVWYERWRGVNQLESHGFEPGTGIEQDTTHPAAQLPGERGHAGIL